MADSNLRPVVVDAAGNRPLQRAPLTLHSDNLAHLLPALILARKDFPEIPRSREVKVKPRDKPEYRFKYAPLDAIDKIITPILAAHELVLTQTAVRYPDGDFLRTTLWHTSGEWLASEVQIQVPSGGGSAGYGGALTYARRYGLSALLAIATETDNDAEHDGQRRQAARGNNQRAADDSEARIQPGQVRQLRQAIIATGRKEPDVVAFYADRYSITKLEELPASAFERVKQQLSKPPARAKAGDTDHHDED